MSIDGFRVTQTAAALELGREANAREIRDFAERNGIDLEAIKTARQLSAEVRKRKSEKYAQRIGILERAVDRQERSKKFAQDIIDAEKRGAKADVRSLEAEARRLNNQLKRLVDKAALPDPRIKQSFQNAMRIESGGGLKTSYGQALINVMLDPDPFAIDNKPLDQRKADTNAGVYEVLQLVNNEFGSESDPEPIFKFNPETRELENLDELQSPDGDNPLVRTGVLNENQIMELFGTPRKPMVNMITNYEFHQRNIADQREDLEADLNKIGDQIDDISKGIDAGEDPDTIFDRFKGLIQAERDLEELFRDGKGFDELDAEIANEILREQEAADATTLRMEDKVAELLDPTDQVFTRHEREMAQIISGPNFRAWAADNGFDRIGNASRDETGKADVTTYVPGKHDIRALRLFNRQQRMGPGRYGLRNMGTGQFVRFNLDGQTYEGIRLKLHAGDPPGTMRVVVGPGEPMVFSREQVPDVEVVQDSPERVTPRARRATRFFRLNQAKMNRVFAGSRGTDPATELEAAQTKGEDGGAFIRYADGRYVPQDVYDQMRDELIAETQITGRTVGDAQYLVMGNRVFRLHSGPDGGSIPVEITEEDFTQGFEQEGQEHGMALLAEPEPVGLGEVAEDGTVSMTRFLTIDDIKPGVLLAAPESEEDQARYETLQEERRNAVTPIALGLFEDTNPFDASAGAGVTATTDLQGFNLKILSPPPKSERQQEEEARLDPLLEEPSPDVGVLGAQPKADAKDDGPPVTLPEIPSPKPTEESEGDLLESMLQTSSDRSAAQTQNLEDLLYQARKAATTNTKAAKPLAKAYMDAAKAAGVTPQSITMLTREELQKEKLASAAKRGGGVRGDTPQGIKRKRIMLADAAKEVLGQDSDSSEQEGTPALDVTAPAADAGPPTNVVAPGASGVANMPGQAKPGTDDDEDDETKVPTPDPSVVNQLIERQNGRP